MCQTGRKAEHQVIALEQGASRRTLHYFYKFGSGLKTQMSLIWGLGLVHPHVQPGARRISLPASQKLQGSSTALLHICLRLLSLLLRFSRQKPRRVLQCGRCDPAPHIWMDCNLIMRRPFIRNRDPAFLLHKQLRNLAARGMKEEEIEMAR